MDKSHEVKNRLASSIASLDALEECGMLEEALEVWGALIRAVGSQWNNWSLESLWAAGRNLSCRSDRSAQSKILYIGVEEDDVQLFYYFIKSDRNPKEDPLIVWISGGPYCSVLSGLAFEIGPLRFDIKEYKGELPTLVSHPYSWTNWLEENPKFKTNPLYIGGDSYSGKIVPVVTHELIKDIEDGREKHLNLKGYIAGNPLISREDDFNTIYPYAHRMGFISDELYKSAKKRCRGQYLEPMNAQCAEDVKAMKISYRFMLSYFWANNEIVREALHVKKGTIKEWIRCNKQPNYVGDHDMQLPHLGTQAAIKSLNYSIIDHWRPFTIDGQVAGFTISYANNLTFALVKKYRFMLSYFWANNEIVREALHVKKVYNILCQQLDLCIGEERLKRILDELLKCYFHMEEVIRLPRHSPKSAMPCLKGGYHSSGGTGMGGEVPLLLIVWFTHALLGPLSAVNKVSDAKQSGEAKQKASLLTEQQILDDKELVA
ncbi:Serine carboxypeptidase-like 3 [Acorus gramineus]|uniref:Serine carboxypeptidase-like 3 n=1 Tax=Acorus gramineus TaxID=55184 RepID=A0AAV8ZYL3_ACOGR|nr:Serine carboxypeptidase-like 3 [Acorus gramineus]